jgi:hypothetical protein
MSIKHEVTSRSAINWNKVFKIGVIPENVNKAIKKALYKERENIEDIEDAVCIIVVDKKNRQSILTREPTKAMEFMDSGSGESACYRQEKDDCFWLVTCERTSGGQLTASFKECVSEIPPCSEDPEKNVVDIKGQPCPCEEDIE